MPGGSNSAGDRGPAQDATAGSAVEVFIVFLRLGLTSFGGPIAHLGYFRAEFVERRRWLTEQAYVDLVALSQFLPGPASSQTGFAIGLTRAGFRGAAAAWFGFTLPSALLMLLFAWGAPGFADTAWGSGALHGLKLVAVAIVAQAVLGMARTLCPDRTRATIALLAIVIILLIAGLLGQIAAIAVGGGLGLAFCLGESDVCAAAAPPVSRRLGALSLAAFAALLVFAFVPAGKTMLGVFDAFYRSGALVFGGGHVVLPLLRDAVVTPGWVSDSDFLAGYGAAQALPGPLFTFAAYLGARTGAAASAVVALVAIFLPGLLTMTGVLPFWHMLRARPTCLAAMQGINAAVVGLLAAALYDPVWRSAVTTPADFAVAAAAFVGLVVWRLPPLFAVLACAGVGIIGVA